MRLRPFVPEDEIEDIQVNRKNLYPDANAIEDADFFDENLPSVQEESDEEPEEMADINHGAETRPFSDVYAPEVVAPRTSIKHETPIDRHREALTRTQQPPMEIDEDHDDRVPCTLVPGVDQNHERDSIPVSYDNTSVATDIQSQTNNTTRARSTET